MAGERELEAAAHRRAVERADERLAAGLQAPVKLRQLAALGEQHGIGGFVALRLRHGGEGGGESLEQREIGAAAEGRLARGDDGAFDSGIGRDLFDQPAQFLDDVGIDDVHRAAGHIPGDQRYAVRIDVELEIGHRQLPQYGYVYGRGCQRIAPAFGAKPSQARDHGSI